MTLVKCVVIFVSSTLNCLFAKVSLLAAPHSSVNTACLSVHLHILCDNSADILLTLVKILHDVSWFDQPTARLSLAFANFCCYIHIQWSYTNTNFPSNLNFEGILFVKWAPRPARVRNPAFVRLWHTEIRTKWPASYWQHIQIHFCARKFVYSYLRLLFFRILVEFIPVGPSNDNHHSLP